MPALRVHNIAVSLDGYAAGPDQGLDHPLGFGGEQLHEWAFATRSFHRMLGREGGEEGLDDEFIRAADEGIGASIMGRNMFGPVREEWPDESWKGWWGDNPPYHHDVFVLTHHAREPVPMQGGTTFHFVTGGIEEARDRALEAAGGADVRLVGGPSTIRQYLAAGLVDVLQWTIAPVFLGGGVRLFEDLAGGPTGYVCQEFVRTERAVQVRFVRSS